jgi:uncharacterized membrane protein
MGDSPLEETKLQLAQNRVKRFLKAFFSARDDLKLTPRSRFIFILAMLIIVDVVIILDIPFARPVLAFLYFSVVPGLLILDALKSPLARIKRFLVAFGLSVASLMFVAAFFNEICLDVGVVHPISTPYLLACFSFVVVILTGAAFWVTRYDREYIRIPSLRAIVDAEDVPLLLFPTLFPFIAIFGTSVMNTQGNNVVLIALLLLIPLYVIVLAAIRPRMNGGRAVYPVALLMISLALLLRHGLISSYLVGIDVHGEYLAYQTVANNQFWSMAAYDTQTTSTLSSSLLPAVYQGLTGISGFYMFKLVFQVIFSVTPVVVYVIARKYINETYAFLVAFLFMAQIGFMVNLQSAMREEIAILFFALAFLVYVADDIRDSQKALLFIVFASSTVFAHYSTAMVLILVMLVAWISAMLARGYFRVTSRKLHDMPHDQTITFVMIALVATIFFVWYGKLTTSGVGQFFANTIRSFVDLFVLESRGIAAIRAVGPGGTIADIIRSRLYTLVYVLSVIGALAIFFKRAAKRYKGGYPFVALASAVLLVAWVVIPGLGTYSVTRLFQILMSLLGVAFVIGVFTILKAARIKKQYYFLSAVLVIVLLQFASSAYLTDQAVGASTSVVLNKGGPQYDVLYIHPGDEAGAEWLANHQASNIVVSADIGGFLVLNDVGITHLQNPFGIALDYPQRATQLVNDTYIYLRSVNVQGVVVGRSFTLGGYAQQVTSPLANVSFLYSAKNKVYDNGQSEIYR